MSRKKTKSKSPPPSFATNGTWHTHYVVLFEEIARICGNSEQVIWNHYYHPLEDISNKIDCFNEIFKEKAPKPVAV